MKDQIRQLIKIDDTKYMLRIDDMPDRTEMPQDILFEFKAWKAKNISLFVIDCYKAWAYEELTKLLGNGKKPVLCKLGFHKWGNLLIDDVDFSTFYFKFNFCLLCQTIELAPKNERTPTKETVGGKK